MRFESLLKNEEIEELEVLSISKEYGPFVQEMSFKNAVCFHHVQDGEAAYNVVLYLEQLCNGGVLGHLDPLAFVCKIVFLV